MEGQPSATARRVALARAGHQLIESGAIFSDHLALLICGGDQHRILEEARLHPELRPLRLFVAARSRFAEDSALRAIDRGVCQVVVLGAGLDTFGMRNPNAGVCVYEVDTPATQQWKLECLARAKLTIPETLRFAAVDFERQSFVDVLRAAGFRTDQSAFFMWLGVVPYLSKDAVFQTLSAIARSIDSEVVFDYGLPVDALPPERRSAYEALIARAADLGEPWLSFFRPEELNRDLRELGFSEIEDLGLSQILSRYSDTPQPALPAGGGRISRARRPG